MRVAIVKAAHDDEASVWYVEHSDVGDLLDGEGGEVQIEIIAHASMRARAAA
jgi:hypothetical protein